MNPSAAAAVAVAAALSLGCSGVGAARPRSPAAPVEDSRTLLVTLRPGAESRWRAIAGQLEELYSIRTLAAWYMRSLGEQCLVLATPPWLSPERIATRLGHHPDVSGAVVQHRFHVLGGPRDPYATLQREAVGMDLESVHRTATGAGVSIAIVDTGIDVTHPELAGQVIRAIDIAGHERGSFTGEFHGTAVGGVIAASADNGIGGAGISPDARLWSLRACWQEEEPGSRAAACDSYTLAQALDVAIVDTARVINLSLAGEPDALIERLVRRAVAGGAAVVVAAEGDPPSFPASIDGVIPVYSEASSRIRSGLRRDPPASALVAPGVDLLAPVPGSGYDFVSGSSFAAAWVSGFAALLIEADPGLSAEEIAALLREATSDSGPGTARRLDPCAALRRYFDTDLCTDPGAGDG